MSATISSGGLGFGLAFTLQDLFSGTANKIKRQFNSLGTSSQKMSNTVTKSVKGMNNGFDLFVLNDAFRQLEQSFGSIIKIGSEYQDTMADLQAITGIAGSGLDELGGFARKLAVEFGGDAASSVEVFKLLLSQLGPSLAETPEVLFGMARNVSLLSKTMGGDVVAASSVLTGAMNQYGVSIEDPKAALAEMTKQMNIMSAAAKEGSSELPNQMGAIQKVGGFAHNAGLSFSDMSAAIQVLGKDASKYGSEGGRALLNVLARLGSGRFMENQSLEALTQAKVDVDALGDKSLTLSDRLRALKPIINDSALIGKLFGVENVLAGQALIQGVDKIDLMRNSIEGTNTTFEQAAIKMDTYSEKLSRMQAFAKDFAIDFFNATESVLPYLAMLGQSLFFFTQLAQAMVIINKLLQLEAVLKIRAAIAQWVLNVASYAFPTILIVAGILLIVGVIYLFVKAIMLVVEKWDEWGAALMVLLGPLGMVISIIAGIVENWDALVDSFSNGGFLAGMKALGSVILSSILYPLQQALELLSNIPGLGKLMDWAMDLQEYREEGLDINKSDNSAELGNDIANTKALGTSANTVVNNTNKNDVKTNLKVYLDSDEIASKVEEKQEFEESIN